MTSTHEAEFNLPTLRPNARRAHIIPELHNCSLLSIGQLTDSGYIAVFDAKYIKIYDSPTIEAIDSTKCVLSGTRHNPSGMWHIDTPSEPIQSRWYSHFFRARCLCTCHNVFFCAIDA